MGFIVQKHYCKEELKNVSILFKAESCQKEKAKKPVCPMHTENKDSQKDDHSSQNGDCCKDTVEVLKPEVEVFANVSGPHLEITPIFLGVIGVTLQLFKPEIYKLSSQYYNYKPPLLVCNFTVSLQTFLC